MLPPAPHAMLTALRNVLLFCLSLAVLLRLVDAVSPAPTTTVASAKLREVQQAAPPYDAIFVGNSHVYRHVVPEQFDTAMARLQRPVRSYNLAAPGMTYPEMDYVIRHVLARDPDLRLVVIDTSVDWEEHEENLASERSIAWHDVRGTWLASDLTLHDDAPLVQRNDLVNRHWSLFFSRETHHGRALQWLSSLWGQAPAPFDMAGHAQGFLALDADPDPSLQLRRGQFVRERGQFRDEVNRLRRKGRVWTPCTPVENDQVRGLVRRLERHGIQVVFYFSPLLDAEVPDWRAAAPDVPYFLFNDPDRFPTLYDFTRRFDPNHMNARGAAAFTLALADSVASVLPPR